jgi:hypothetical protein
MLHRGDWVLCLSCWEASIYVWHDPAEFVCSVCGGHAFEIERQEVSYGLAKCLTVRLLLLIGGVKQV